MWLWFVVAQFADFALSTLTVANCLARGDNHLVPHSEGSDSSSTSSNPFAPGTMVVATLGNPREKFWGAVLALSSNGLSLCGVELASFDDLVSLVQQNEPFSPAVVFFPMHRIERVELDLPDGNIASLTQRFETKTKLDAVTVLMEHQRAGLVRSSGDAGDPE
jgi:hypothetical protein